MAKFTLEEIEKKISELEKQREDIILEAQKEEEEIRQKKYDELKSARDTYINLFSDFILTYGSIEFDGDIDSTASVLCDLFLV